MALFFNLLDISALNVILIWMKHQTSLQCQKCVHRALRTASVKSLAANYTLHVCRPVSFHLCLVSEDTNRRRKCYLRLSENYMKSKISCNDCQQSICGEHRVNFCLQCKKIGTIVMFTYTFLITLC